MSKIIQNENSNVSVSQPTEHNLEDILRTLAAYQDTGFTPDDINALMSDVTEGCEYTYELAARIANLLRKLPSFKHCKIEDYGPFGIQAESSVFIEDGEKVVGALTIRYYGDPVFHTPKSGIRFGYKNTAKKIANYPAGSTGELNGYDYPTEPLPTDLKSILKIMKISEHGSVGEK